MADYPTDLSVRDLARRALRFIVAWSLASGLFVWALQVSTKPGASEPSLAVSLIVHGCGTVWNASLIMVTAGWLVRRRWRTWPDARQRHLERGFYGLMSWPEIVIGVIVLETIGCAGAIVTLRLFFQYLWPFPAPTPAPLSAILIWGYTNALLAVSLDYLRRRAVANEVRAEAAQRLAIEAQLQRLQAQLEPHMLFNTLATLHALIETDAPRAQETLVRLIDFLRSTLSASRAATHPLWQEFDRVADYLALMQVRMGTRLQVAFDLPEDLETLLIPPMLLQPLVENAIKHGLEPSRDGGVLTVSAEHDGANLFLSVVDTAMGPRADMAVDRPADPRATPRTSTSSTVKRAPSGFGLSNVQDRLSSLYGKAAELTLAPHPQGGGTLARLRLPIPLSAVPAEPAESLLLQPAP